MFDTLEYSGEVTLKFLHNGKDITAILHNEGTPSLFKLLARALAGYDTRIETPKKLQLYKKGSAGEYISILKSPIPLTGITYTQLDNDWCALFTGVINSTNLSTTPEATITYYLALTSSSDVDLAYLTVPADFLTNLKRGVQGLVEWRMKVKNVSESTNGGTN